MNIESFKKLNNQGQTVIYNGLLQYYQTLGMTNEELVFFIELQSFIENGDRFPNIQKISDRMGLSGNRAFQIMNGLIEKHLIVLITEKNSEDKSQDYYDTSPTFEKLLTLYEQQQTNETQVNTQNQRKAIFDQIEVEFGRPLSPMELETIGYWFSDDHYDPELIILALKEAVLNQAYSLRYMERILLNWEKKNLTTKEQVLNDRASRNQF